MDARRRPLRILAERSAARLCVEDRRTEPGDCVHQIGNSRTLRAHLDVCNKGVAVDLSQLLAAAGQTEQAAALRRAASLWNDANEAKYLGDSRRIRAGVLLLDGKPDAALAELAESFRLGYYANWWYTIDYDPLWLPLHGDARFQAIAADVRRYVDAQRSQLEALRQHGDVPRRGDAPAAH